MRCRKEEVFASVPKTDPFWKVMNVGEEMRELSGGAVGE